MSSREFSGYTPGLGPSERPIDTLINAAVKELRKRNPAHELLGYLNSFKEFVKRFGGPNVSMDDVLANYLAALKEALGQS